MRRIISLFLIMFLVLSGLGLTVVFDFTTDDVSGKEVSGTLTSSTIWTFSDSPVYVVGDLTINSGWRLTINPGVEVQFNGTYSIIVNPGAKLVAKGSKGSEINFKQNVGSPVMINAQNSGQVELDWCTFEDAGTAIDLDDSHWRVNVTNCTFTNCVPFFNLFQSKLNVTSSKFDGSQFDQTPHITTENMANNITIGDNSISELNIQYFVNVDTINGTGGPVGDVTVEVQDNPPRNNIQGKTDGSGEFYASPITAVRITKITPEADFSYQNTITVYDKWDGNIAREVVGISRNSTQISNASTYTKDSDLHINLVFMFKYPPVIQTTSLTGVKVYEDIPKTATFTVFDNDDLNNTYNNLTFNITDGNGNGIYGTNTLNEWVTWDSNTNQLQFYRTIESPLAPNDFDAQVNEEINIKVFDDDGLVDSVGPFNIEWHNVPDKPEITGLPSAQDVTEVTEDEPKYLSIVVSDNDNKTSDIKVTSSSKYVSYDIASGFPNNQSLKLKYENEFGIDKKQELVYINATDGCYNEISAGINLVSYSFLVRFRQTPDPPEILGDIPDKYGNETNWESDMALSQYAYDPDPDDTSTDLKWYVTGIGKKVNGEQLFTVSNENATADAPLSFNLNPDIDLGGARDIPLSVEEKITIWLMDKDGNTTSQDVSLIVNATNQPPSLHKIDKEGAKITVEPETGVTSDTYTFMIEYKDQDGQKGDAPEFVKVVIDDKEYDMVEVDTNDKNYKNGKKYKYETSMLGAGVHTHYFKCSDSVRTTRLPLIDADPSEITGPDIEARINILKKTDPEGHFTVRIAHMDFNPFAEIVNVSKPAKELEPGVSSENKTKQDIGKYFRIDNERITSIIWAELIVRFGDDYKNYDVTWLRKTDLQVGYYQPVQNSWTSLTISTMDTKTFILRCNLTPQTGQSELLEEIVNTSNRPIFTVIGMLDADGDGVFNSKDAFPFDPAASEDTDNDGSPDRWNPSKSKKDSTTGLHLDDFKSDPSASIDKDNDNCPDEWNEGKGQKDSTSSPKLTLDQFPDDKRACLDTDGDNMPDSVRPGPGTPLVEDSDDDNDGMPDWWEDEQLQYAIDHNLSNRFDPKNASDADKDFDGDGRKNIDEYKEKSNPYVKDVDDGVLGAISENPLLLLILILVIVIIIIAAIFVLRKRGKKEPEDLPRGMGAPPPESEGGEGEIPPDQRVEPPIEPESEGEIPPMMPPEAEAEAPFGIEDAEPSGEGEPEPVLGGEPEGAPEAPPEAPSEAPAPGEEGTVVEETAPSEMPVETPAEPEPPAETTEEVGAPAAEFSCPNCNAGLTRDMTQCPGCGAPLAFD